MRLKVLIFVGAVSLTMALSGCEGNQNLPSTTEATEPSPPSFIPSENPLGTPPPDTSDEPERVSENPFLLSDEERKIFDEYVVKKDISIFKGVPPISVAKIYIECGITGNWEAEYNMYAPETVQMTKEEWKQLNDADLSSSDLSSRRMAADDIFSIIDQGQVTDTEDGNTMITFKTYTGEVESRMYLTKMDEDMWLIRYDPFAE